MREIVFISYSHKDHAWYKAFESALNIGGNKAILDAWSDQKIGIGDNWQATIESAINTARVALLLVTHNFLHSTYIQSTELMSLLSRQKAGELDIWWVPIDELSSEELEISGLSSLQAAWDPKQSLVKLKGRARVGAVSSISARLILKLGLIADIAKATRDELQQAISRVLGRNIEIIQPIAPGDFSILYKAVRRGGDRVAIKALVPMPRREWLAEDFINRAEAVRDISNSHIIKILDIFRQAEDPLSKRKVNLVVMELVSAPTLATVLKQRGLLPAAEVAGILSQLANAASELHSPGRGDSDVHPMVVGPLRPRQVFYGAARKVQISLVHIANETMQSCQDKPILLLDPDALTYLSPERYKGDGVGQRSDQYYLGLFALELLLGHPPVLVQKFSDLKLKDEFFNDPKAFFRGLCTSEPALSFILMRMLEREPQERWLSMELLSVALEQLAQGRLPDSLREYAAGIYETVLRMNNDFFQRFYDYLFELSPDVAEIFNNKTTDMRQQHVKLNAAMDQLLSYSPVLKVNSLYHEAERHSTLGLRTEHFDTFRDAFLRALSELPGANDAYAQCAWRAILDSGLAYMRRRCCGDNAGLPTPTLYGANVPGRPPG
ncbi:protein kinase domain-containing protein [Mesorhizobium escarrei]|uniref:Protein kinase domain-containing protein n=1 Tax=Mesorhizobium escarrei TaxID=666018 RepID=A0ABM9EJS3_9HYPH|nr:TIR domain-containing protein [Mesorhizobium escarrei]CAH2409642.1 hypothetical protein MES5069_920010 [Mesorhizobium escarrei]